jgi:hypothetical protein
MRGSSAVADVAPNLGIGGSPQLHVVDVLSYVAVGAQTVSQTRRKLCIYDEAQSQATRMTR